MIDTKPTRGSHDSLDNELAFEFGYCSDVSDQLYLEYATSDNDSHFPRKRKHHEFDAEIDMKNPASDLNIENSHAWTFMSDRQKGLISILRSLFPDSEHRFCVRHMYQNFVKISEHRGKALKDYFWAATRASYPGEFNYWMNKIEKTSDSAYKWLKNKLAQEWSM
ncbi:hypothetical protein V6N11_065208 [Hibiscus sabdariffa]|uniref:MULE transposase domain-containing protein n=2 Tax=Hibiscus sabdariffa TaxID=183260 RepID=A0ABR2BU65_9ROSI